MSISTNLMAQWWEMNCAEQSVPADEVWYWAPEQVTLHDTKAGDLEVVSHTFSNGKGIVKFNYPFEAGPEWNGRRNAIPALFWKCSTVTRVRLPEYGGIQITGNYFCSGCTALEHINLPLFMWRIGAYSFNNCKVLEPPVLPTYVKQIQGHAFGDCKKLDYTSLPDSIEDLSGFNGCNNLALVALPSGVAKINYGTFDGCYDIKIKRIPSACTTINGYAFLNCIGLTEITFDGTPTTIVDTAFSGCANLADIYVPWSSTDAINANAPWGATNATIHYDFVS